MNRRTAPRRVTLDWSHTPVERLLGERPPFGAPVPGRDRLGFRLAVVAAIERFTAMLGDRVPAAEGLDRAGADEVTLGLLRRHGAEEVEHLAVASDMDQHCGGTGAPRYARRFAGTAVTAPVTLSLGVWGTAYLIRQDPRFAGRVRYSLAAHNRAGRKGLLPSWRALDEAIPRSARRSYHPSREGSSSRAVAYPERSPAARSAS